MVISKEALDATIKEYANCADTSFENALFDIFETELGEDVAAENELTLDQIGDAADFYYWTPQREQIAAKAKEHLTNCLMLGKSQEVAESIVHSALTNGKNAISGKLALEIILSVREEARQKVTDAWLDGHEAAVHSRLP